VPRPRCFHVIRYFDPLAESGIGTGVEVAPDEDLTSRCSIWPGATPQLPRNSFVAESLITGHVAGKPVWVEARPGGATLLACLQEPTARLSIGKRDILTLLGEVTQGLIALHASGMTHSALSAERVMVGLDGHAVLVGSTVSPKQEPTNDHDELITLADWLGVIDTLDWAQPLSNIQQQIDAFLSTETTQPSMFRWLAQRSALPVPLDAQTIWVESNSLGSIDEVVQDLGPDERVVGLLDGWNGTGRTGEISQELTRTRELTSEIEGPGQAHQRQLAMMAHISARVGDLLDNVQPPPGPWPGGEGRTSPGRQNHPPLPDAILPLPTPAGWRRQSPANTDEYPTTTESTEEPPSEVTATDQTNFAFGRNDLEFTQPEIRGFQDRGTHPTDAGTVSSDIRDGFSARLSPLIVFGMGVIVALIGGIAVLLVYMNWPDT